MRPVLKVQSRWSPFNAAEHEMSQNIEADRVHTQCIFDGAGYFFESEGRGWYVSYSAAPGAVT